MIFKNIVKIQLIIIIFCLGSCTESLKKENQKILALDKKEKLNVLLTVDDLNCDLGAYGNKIVKTPNINRLAERGILFQNAHTQYPWCGPSRASFMTGMYTNQTKIMRNNN